MRGSNDSHTYSATLFDEKDESYQWLLGLFEQEYDLREIVMTGMTDDARIGDRENETHVDLVQRTSALVRGTERPDCSFPVFKTVSSGSFGRTDS